MRFAGRIGVALVLIAAIPAMWLVREQSTHSDSLSSRPVERPPGIESDEERIEASPIENPAPVENVARSLPPSGPAPIFSEVRVTGTNYLNARSEAEVLIQSHTNPAAVMRSRIVQLNVAGIQRFFDLASQSPEQLSEQFDVTIFSELPCFVAKTEPVSIVEDSNSEMILAACLNGSRLTMSRNTGSGAFAYSIRNGRSDHRLTGLTGEGDYALLYELDPALRRQHAGDDLVEIEDLIDP